MSATHIPIALRRQVRLRASECCEYCLIPESMTWAVHTIDHIVAEKHGGTTAADNLALACMICNSRKGSDLASIDEQTGSIEALFHPRRDRWTDHFRLVRGRIEPLTATGRATVRLLRLNEPQRVQERELLVAIRSIREPTA
jgi:HNH endonuclease